MVQLCSHMEETKPENPPKLDLYFTFLNIRPPDLPPEKSYLSQEATVKPDMEQQTGYKLRRSILLI